MRCGPDPASRDGQRVAGRVPGGVDERRRRLRLLALSPAAREPQRLTGDERPEGADREHRQAHGDPLGLSLAGRSREPALPLSDQLPHGGGS